MSRQMSEQAPFSAGAFRTRALSQSGNPVEGAWRDHGDHVLNPEMMPFIEGLKLRDAAVLVPVILRHWHIDQLEGLSPEAEEARTRMFKRMDRIARAGRRFSARRE